MSGVSKEEYRVKDFQGYTRVLVYEKKYDVDTFDEVTKTRGGYLDVIRIESCPRLPYGSTT